MPPIQLDNVFWNISVLVDQALVAGICLHQAPYILQGSWRFVYKLLCVLNDRIRSLLNRRSMQIHAICLNEKHTMRISANCCCSECLTTSPSTQTQSPLTTSRSIQELCPFLVRVTFNRLTAPNDFTLQWAPVQWWMLNFKSTYKCDSLTLGRRAACYKVFPYQVSTFCRLHLRRLSCRPFVCI